MSRRATLTAAVATGAAVAVGWRQLGNGCIGQAVPLFTYKDNGEKKKNAPKKTKTLRALVQLKAQGSYIQGMPSRVLLFLTTSYQLDTSLLHISKTYDAYNVAAF